MRREHRRQRETRDEMRAVRKQIEDLEFEIDRARRENGRRREVISKKEIGVMERAKKSQNKKAAN